MALAVKCGGHNDDGIKDGVLIDLNPYMHGIEIDVENETVNVQGGAVWKDVHGPLLDKGFSVVGASISSVSMSSLESEFEKKDVLSKS